MKQYAANWILAITPGLIYPLLAFAYYLQHKERRGRIQKLLNIGDVKQAYNEAYGEKAVPDEDPLRLDLKSWIIPLSISVLTAVAGTAVCMIRAGREFGLGASLESWIQTHAGPFAAAGFAGGYLWGLYDLLDRFGILNWTTESIHWVYFRLALGPVLGGYISSLANPQIGGFLAFAVAAFPTAAIRDRIEALARSKLNLPESTEPSAKPNWELIQGLTPDIID